MPQFMSSALIFAIFAMISAARHDETLQVAQAFTSLSSMSLLTFPLNQLVQAVPQLLACSACFGRIEEFLEQPEKNDVCELEFEPNGLDDPQTYMHECSENDKQDEKIHVGPFNSAISIHDASFAWSLLADPIFHDINLEIPTHSIEVLLGPIGSGKSALIQGILGNAHLVTGNLHVVSGNSSYCRQTSWLMSGTVRNNITAGSPFDEEWYGYTLWACSLDHDLQQLSTGDLTEVGSNGTALSGGQKQRVVSLYLP
jgi:ATP-binding cassette subfamily C (CFTR/MRP) protein 1